MIEFFEALGAFPYLRHAVLAGLLASVACGVVGTFVVTRRITYITGSIAHFVLGGMGAAQYVSVVYGVKALTPLHGAVASALLAALLIGFVRLRARDREDTIIGAMWAIGMAVGILFISQTPGYRQDLMSYLFGNIQIVSPAGLYLIGILDAIVLGVCALFYRQLVAVCFDEEFARLRGVPVNAFYLLLLCLTALTVVLLITVVGVVMVIALVTLPAAVAGQFSRRVWHMMVLSTLLVALLTTSGLALSYAPDLPAGATIVVLTGAVYLVVTLARASRFALRSQPRRR